MSTFQSTVKWFDAKKGYGFINHPEDGDDVFVHYSQIESDNDFKTLRTGQTVHFEMEDGPKGLHALNVVAEEDQPSDADRDSDPPLDPSDAELEQDAARPDEGANGADDEPEDNNFSGPEDSAPLGL